MILYLLKKHHHHHHHPPHFLGTEVKTTSRVEQSPSTAQRLCLAIMRCLSTTRRTLISDVGKRATARATEGRCTSPAQQGQGVVSVVRVILTFPLPFRQRNLKKRRYDQLAFHHQSQCLHARQVPVASPSSCHRPPSTRHWPDVVILHFGPLALPPA